MEKVDEIKDGGNSYDFGARMLDPRIGRFLSLDPDYFRYPWNSPYDYAINSPIKFIDQNGEGPDVIINNSSSKVKLTGGDDFIHWVEQKDGNYKAIKMSGMVGSIVLNPGDKYEEFDEPFKYIDENGKTHIFSRGGKITRKDGTTEMVLMNDIDFIDVEKGQTFKVNGEKVTNDKNKEMGGDDENGRVYTPGEKVLDNQEVDNEGETPVNNKEFVPTPNKGEIKLNDTVGTVILTDEKVNGKKTGNIKVEKTGWLGTISTKKK